MATRLITPFCAASALFAALVADGALPLSWAQLKPGALPAPAAEGAPKAQAIPAQPKAV